MPVSRVGPVWNGHESTRRLTTHETFSDQSSHVARKIFNKAATCRTATIQGLPLMLGILCYEDKFGTENWTVAELYRTARLAFYTIQIQKNVAVEFR